MSITRAHAGGTGRALLVAVLAAAVLLVPMTTGSAAPGSGPGQQEQAGSPGGGQQRDATEEPVWQGVPGTNLAHDTYGYPWPAAPDCDESDVSGGCVSDGVGFFQGQCTSWVAYRLGQRNGVAFSNWFGGAHWGNAVDWARVARRLGYARNKVPAVGAVGWYARGHVSYVEDVNSDGSVVVSEMNTDGHNAFHVVTTYPGGPGYPDRFIHVSDIVPVDYTPPGPPTPVTARHGAAGVEVAWQAPSDDTGVAGYRVTRNGVPLAETARPGYLDREASPGQPYTYDVVALDSAGNVSPPAAARVGQSVPVTGRRSAGMTEASEVTTANGSVVCGRLGGRHRQHLGCRVRTLDGWEMVVTGRTVDWGLAGTRAFVASPADTRIWFCRELTGGRSACLPLDLATLSWGFDRVDLSRQAPTESVWLASAAGAARCGVSADRASCSVLAPAGWRSPRRADDARPGDPLSRAFVPTRRGVAFCRVVEGRATCTTLDVGRDDWGRPVSRGRDLAHGRWTARRAGPTLCPMDRGGCAVVSPPRA